MKEVVTYYILFIIFLLTLFGVAGGALSALASGSVGGMFAIVLGMMLPLAWSWWLAYVMKGCAGKQNWLMPE